MKFASYQVHSFLFEKVKPGDFSYRGNDNDVRMVIYDRYVGLGEDGFRTVSDIVVDDPEGLAVAAAKYVDERGWPSDIFEFSENEDHHLSAEFCDSNPDHVSNIVIEEARKVL